MNSPCIIIPVLVGLISALLGYLLGKSMTSNKSNDNSLELELDSCKRRSDKLSAELESLKLSKASAGTSQGFVSEKLIAHAPFDASLAASMIGKKVKENDLKIVEGIGPKIEELFHASGILTWRDLSEASVDRCKEILNNAGERFAIHNPTTWPRQANLAYEGKWKELKEWQDTLDGGKE